MDSLCNFPKFLDDVAGIIKIVKSNEANDPERE